MERKATAVWRGDVRSGRGSLSTESSSLHEAQYSFGTRFENGIGTNPEELLAAAHAGCFAMAVSSQLGKIGLRPERLEATATITFQKIGEHVSITESARLLVDALEHNTSDLQKLIPAYALLSRIRLSSSSSVLAKAEEVIKTIMTTYPQPNLTAEQIQFRAVNGEDPLRQFGNACRTELESMQKQL